MTSRRLKTVAAYMCLSGISALVAFLAKYSDTIKHFLVYAWLLAILISIVSMIWKTHITDEDGDTIPVHLLPDNRRLELVITIAIATVAILMGYTL